MTLFVYIDLNFSFNFGHYFNIFQNTYSVARKSEFDFLLVHSEWKYYSEKKQNHQFIPYIKLKRLLIDEEIEEIYQITQHIEFNKYSKIIIYIYKGGIEFMAPLSKIHDYLESINLEFSIWNTLFLIPFESLILDENQFDSKFQKEINKAKKLLSNRRINLCFDVESSIWDNYFDNIYYLPPPLLKNESIYSQKRSKQGEVTIAIDVWNLSHAPKYRYEHISILKFFVSEILKNYENIIFRIKIADSKYKIQQDRDSFFLNNSRIKLYNYLSEKEYIKYIQTTDIYILQYSPVFYKNKSSGHFIELIQNGVFVIGTKKTFLERNLPDKRFTYEFGNKQSLIDVCSKVLDNKSYLRENIITKNYKKLISTWSEKHFQYMVTHPSQNNLDNKDSKRTNKPFIVLGNGPSLKGFDFFKLTEYDTIGMNAAYRYWDRINWYPTYYICLDTVVVKSHHKEINRLVQESDKLGIKKFFVREHLFELEPQLKDHPKVITYEDMKKEKPLAFDCVHVTTGSFAARLAINEGYKDILLLGIDENYVNFIKESKRREDIKLEIVETPKSNPNYFFDDYQQKGDLYQVANHDKVYICNCRHCNGETRRGHDLHVDAWKFIEMDLKDPNFIKEYGRVQIINCNPDSGVRFFPFKEFDQIIQKIANENSKIIKTKVLDNKEFKLPVISFYGNERLIEKSNIFHEVLEDLNEFDMSIRFRSFFNEDSFAEFSESSPPMPFILNFFTLFDFGNFYRIALKSENKLINIREVKNDFKVISLRLIYNKHESSMKIFNGNEIIFDKPINNISPISKVLIIGAGFKFRYWKGEILELEIRNGFNGEVVYNLDENKLKNEFKSTDKISLEELFA